MARSDKRYMVYPSPRSIEILGASSPGLNQALECWASQIARAIGDNANEFGRSYDCSQISGTDYQILDEWAILEHSLRSRKFDPDFPKPGEFIALAVEDAERFEHVSWKHSLGPDFLEGDKIVEPRKREMTNLLQKLRNLDYAHGWAVIVTVQWFWENSNSIDAAKDDWWTLSFRLEFGRKRAQGKESKRGKSPKAS